MLNYIQQIPMVSVVMGVYNGQPHLNEAVESILNQTYRDFEFIIVEDGSTDDSWQILQTYAVQDRRIRLLRNPRNLGLIATLNNGLAIARGPIIARMDADDICMPQRLAKQVAYMENHPEIGLLGSGYIRLYDDGQCSEHYPPTSHTEIRWRLLFGNIWPHPALVIRRSILLTDEVIYQDYQHAEDYELWVRLSQRTLTTTLPDTLITIRTRERDGISATNRNQQIEMVRAISRSQIGAMMPERNLKAADYFALQQLYQSNNIGWRELLTTPLFLELVKRFGDQPDIDRKIFAHIRWRWFKRLLLLVWNTVTAQQQIG